MRPASVAAWAGRRILAESGRIDEVARRLGMSSLDRTARFIAFDWQDDRSMKAPVGWCRVVGTARGARREPCVVRARWAGARAGSVERWTSPVVSGVHVVAVRRAAVGVRLGPPGGSRVGSPARVAASAQPGPQRFPDEPELWLPETPMRRHHYLYARTRWLTDPGILAELRVMHRRLAADQAESLGLLDPDGPGSWTHPHLSRMLYADGKVLTPLFRAQPGDTRLDKTTGELRPLRAEPDAGLHSRGPVRRRGGPSGCWSRCARMMCTAG